MLIIKKIIEELFEEYSLNVYNCGEEGKANDAEIISELIFIKYCGEDMIDILTEVLKLIHKRNHFVSKNISID